MTLVDLLAVTFENKQFCDVVMKAIASELTNALIGWFHFYSFLKYSKKFPKDK